MYAPFNFEIPSVRKSTSWDITRLDMAKIFQKMDRYPTFQKCFDLRYNLTDALLEQLAEKTWGESHRIMTLMGETGSGKSLVAQMIARMIAENTDVPFEDENIQFTFEGVIDRVKNMPKNSTIICDESVLMGGAGMIRERYDLVNLENVTRKFGLNIEWVYPVPNIEHPTAHIQMETISISRAEKLTKLAVKDGNYYYGYAVLDVSEALDEVWIRYNKRKDEFIEQLMSRRVQRLDFEKYASELLADDGYFEMLVNGERFSKLKLYVRTSSIIPTNLTEQELSQVVFFSQKLFRKEERTERVTESQMQSALDVAFPNRNRNFEDFRRE